MPLYPPPQPRLKHVHPSLKFLPVNLQSVQAIPNSSTLALPNILGYHINGIVVCCLLCLASFTYQVLLRFIHVTVHISNVFHYMERPRLRFYSVVYGFDSSELPFQLESVISSRASLGGMLFQLETNNVKTCHINPTSYINSSSSASYMRLVFALSQ